MCRLDRKNSTDIIFLNRGGLNDAFDDMIKSVFRINDAEYDLMCEFGTDQELNATLCSTPTYKQKKEMIIALESILLRYNNSLVT